MAAINVKSWQLAVGALALSAIGGLVSGRPRKTEVKLYTRELKQAPWAPPPWAFAPAWTANNYFLLRALKKILELKDNDPVKKKLLQLQVPIWFIFFTFNYLYVNKKSTVLAAVWTLSDAILALTSFKTAFSVDKKMATNFLPLSAWTTFASSLAVYQAVKNDDKFLGVKALA